MCLSFRTCWSNKRQEVITITFIGKIKQFFTSYRGLIALIILFELAIIVFLSTFSKPVVEIFGKPLIPVDLDNSPRTRAGRIIMLYHSLAVPFLAAVSYFVLDWYEIRGTLEIQAKWAITIGALLTGFFGMVYGYSPIDSQVPHGVFIFGLSLSFYGAILLLIGIWPSTTFPTKKKDAPYWRQYNLEYFSMSLTILAILISSIIGAWVGSNIGTNFEVVLAEDVVRAPGGNVGYSLKEMVVSHLHIMVALLAAAVLLLTLKYSGMKGKLLKVCHILYNIGVVIISIGAWLVITPWEKAHVVINVGAMFLLLVGMITAIYGIVNISRRKLGVSYDSSPLLSKIMAVFKDPVDFTLYFQLIWVNVTSTFPGVYVAIHLEKFRTDEYTEIERTFNTGHWHVISTICAIMVLMLAVKYLDIKGKIHDFIGWSSLIGSILGFGFATLYMLRSPDDKGLTLFLLIDIGVMFMFMATGIFGIYYLIKHFLTDEFETGVVGNE